MCGFIVNNVFYLKCFFFIYLKLDIILILYGFLTVLNCIIFDCNRYNIKIWNYLVKFGFRNILIMICRFIFEDLYRIENIMFWYLNFFIDGFVYIKFYLCRLWYCFIWVWSECWFFIFALIGLIFVIFIFIDIIGININGLVVVDLVSIGSMWKEKKFFFLGNVIIYKFYKLYVEEVRWLRN